MMYYFKALSNYAVFSGRATRSEFWYFILFDFIIMFVLSFFGEIIGFSSLVGIYYIGTIIPHIAVGVRRMHDVGRSGWNLIIPIYNLILACTDSDIDTNAYGPNPKFEADYGAADYQKPFDINP
jgi:uncharacterized membrane protein YhaH (DUF805 family)